MKDNGIWGKMFHIIKIVLLGIWFLVLFMAHMFFGLSRGAEERDIKIFGIVLIVVWWVLTLAAYKLYDVFDNRRRGKIRVRNKKHISKEEFYDERFGAVVLDHDLERHDLAGEIPDVDFGGEKIPADVAMFDDGEDLNELFKNLKSFCDRAEEMKNRIYPGLAEELKDADNDDGEGNLIEITEKFLRENFEFTCFYLTNAKKICLWGSWEDSGSQDYAIEYDCEKDTFEYYLL